MKDRASAHALAQRYARDRAEEARRAAPRQSRIVELRYFTGLSIDETAEVLGISPATVKRDWMTARAWLQREMIRRAEA